MAKIILFNKPFNVLSQFTDTDGRSTLADYLSAPSFRVAGRLDYDSEGLLVLTDDGHLQQQIANPAHNRWKTYWVQVEGDPDEKSLEQLSKGVKLKDGMTLPAKVGGVGQPEFWHREPPIRIRKTVRDSWFKLSIREGRNRQIRRMTANIGFPTLRLIRIAVGQWALRDLQPGQHREITLPGTVGRSASNPQREI